MVRPPNFLGLAPRPVRDNDSFVLHTEPVTLTAVHPLRRNKCLLCRYLIGAEPVVFVCLVVATEPGCECGQIPVIAQLVHASCGVTTTRELVRAAVTLTCKEHERA